MDISLGVFPASERMKTLKVRGIDIVRENKFAVI